MRIEWSPDLAVGVDFIDAQHKELFRRTNALLEACVRGEGREAVVSTITFLTQYVVEHFNAEEAAMRSARYEGFAEHARMHREFRQTVDDFAREIMQRGVGADTIIRVNRMIVAWLNNHIRKVDKEMAVGICKTAPEVLATRT